MSGLVIGYNELTEIITNAILKSYEDEISMATLIHTPDLTDDPLCLARVIESTAQHISDAIIDDLKGYLTTRLVLVDDSKTIEPSTGIQTDKGRLYI